MGLIQGFKGMILPTGVSLSANTASIGSGVEYQLIPYITPALSSNNKIHWSTNNNNVTVDDNGVVTGVTDGTSIVTATTDYGGYTASCTFTIFTIHVTGITLNESSVNLSPGKTIQLEATITPDNATNKRVTWRSTDTSVATVDSNGLVTCLAGSGGTADIIATTVDGNYTATCTVKQGWGPGVNTLLYVPMETDLLDYSGNNIDITNYGISVNNTVLSDIGVGYFKGSADDRLEFSGITFGTNSFTISRWEKSNSTSSGSGSRFSSARTTGSWAGLLLGYNQTNLYAGSGTSWNVINGASAFNSNTEDWVHWTIIRDGNNRKTYRNKTLYWSGTASGSVGYNTEVIGNYRPGDKNPYNGYMSRFIIESSVWDENYISEYIDLTKADYEDKIENYQEVEYIQSSGSQYIDTGVTSPTNYLKTYMKINPQTVSTGSQDYRAGGAYNGNRANVHYIGYGQGRLYAGFGGGDYNTGISISANTLYEITMTANNGSYSVTVNNSTATGTYSGSVAIDKAFFLFRNNENGSAGAGGTFKIYSFQITTSNGLVRDFVPCYRKSDSVIGMFDKIENKFYTNKGSGTFTAGPKIGITLSSNSISLTEAGQTEQLTVTANPSSIGSQGYQWRSSDTTIATVSSNGLVTCVTPGECIITCTAVNGGYTDTCAVKQGWSPGVNTLLYVPMKSDLTDHGLNQYTLTNNGVTLVQNQANIDVGYFDGSSNIKCSSTISFTDFHIGFWAKLKQVNNQIFAGGNNGDMFLANQSGIGIGIGRNNVAWDNNTSYTFNSNNWYYICYDKTGTNLTITINNSVVLSTTNNKSYTLNGFVIGSNNTEAIYTYGYLSNLIMESVAWTSDEKSDYYNQTKANYGL